VGNDTVDYPGILGSTHLILLVRRGCLRVKRALGVAHRYLISI
jgi:hypothetical protein